MGDTQSMAIRLGRVLRYNRNRIERALSLFDDKKRPLFECIPFLLQINHPDLPGYVEDPLLPYGLLYYSFNRDVQKSLLKIFPEHASVIADPKSFWPKHCVIESLSLMGSIGTMAQTPKSDLDYWVCIDGKKLSAEGQALLQQKLEGIEQWAWDKYHLEVHFFLSDIDKVRNNDFGMADGESAGSAQPLFLKNEYYATNIHISGKMPFWWLVSPECSNEQYAEQYKMLQEVKNPDPKHFMDLGNVEHLSGSEIFGASLWHMVKAMDSPFKSVLKMAKLEVFMDNTDMRMPLCNVIKHHIHTSENFDRNLRGTDPYALMFDIIVKYYQLKNKKFVELFKTCLYIKTGCPLTRSDKVDTKSFQYQLIRDYVMHWKWKQNKIAHFDAIENWNYKQVSRLGTAIHSFLVGCYKRLSGKIKGFDQCLSEQDMTVIGRKIESFYGAKDGKIQYLKRAFDEGLLQKEITITMELDLNYKTKQRWSAFRGRQHYQNTVMDNPALLKQSSDPVDLILWCLFNRVADHSTQFFLLQNQLTINEKDLTELVKGALNDYQPVRVSELPRENLLSPSQITHCLVVVNFASHASISEVESVRVIYQTNWGEVFSFEKIDTFKQLEQRFSSQTKIPVCRLFTPERNDRDVLYNLIEDVTGFPFDKIGFVKPVEEIEEEEEKSSCPWNAPNVIGPAGRSQRR